MTKLRHHKRRTFSNNKEQKLTSDVTVISTEHGRLRRLQRGIEKIDLKVAVKKGKKESSQNGRWRYTFADIVYITDSSSREEITSWRLPSQDMEKAATSSLDENDHKAAKVLICNDFTVCSAHTVVVVDQSGSMRKFDVDGYGTRSNAVFAAVAKDFIAARLRSGFSSNSEVLSIIGMGEHATMLLDREPMTWVLYNKVLDLKQTCIPSSHGNFLPSLQQAEQLMADYSHARMALHLIFLSDGRPSDKFINHDSRGDHIAGECRRIAKRFSDTISMKMIGFGNLSDFPVLKMMAEYAAGEGVDSEFVHSNLDSKTLSQAISSSVTTVAKTIADVAMRAGRTVKDIQKEQSFMSPLVLQSPLPSHWELFQNAFRWEYNLEKNEFASAQIQAGCGIAVCKYSLGSGAERVTYRLREVDFSQTPIVFVGPEMVAKESKYFEVNPNDVKVGFHRTFCATQQRAKQLAIAFNEEVRKLPNFDPSSTPQITFLNCCVYAVDNNSKHYLVEKMLDTSKYQKWNDNAGGFDGHVLRPCLDLHQGIGASQDPSKADAPAPLCSIMECDESEDEGSDDGSDDDDVVDCSKLPEVETFSLCGGELGYLGCKSVKLEDFPQAFSHFTHRYSKRKYIVCDLQGTFNPGSSPPMFELTDPVIHYKSSRGRKRVFGRTDRGRAGIDSFFQTHKCSALCSMSKLARA